MLRTTTWSPSIDADASRALSGSQSPSFVGASRVNQATSSMANRARNAPVARLRDRGDPRGRHLAGSPGPASVAQPHEPVLRLARAGRGRGRCLRFATAQAILHRCRVLPARAEGRQGRSRLPGQGLPLRVALRLELVELVAEAVRHAGHEPLAVLADEV